MQVNKLVNSFCDLLDDIPLDDAFLVLHSVFLFLLNKKLGKALGLVTPPVATVPETAPTVPETAPTVPETAPTVPETAPTVPETAPTVPETAPTVAEPVKTVATSPEKILSLKEKTYLRAKKAIDLYFSEKEDLTPEELNEISLVQDLIEV